FDVGGGVVTHLADESLRPLPNASNHALAGARVLQQMVAVDGSQSLAISASWPQDSESKIQALDLAQGKLAWQQKISGIVDQLLLGESRMLYMLDRSTKKVRRLDTRTLETTDLI